MIVIIWLWLACQWHFTFFFHKAILLNGEEELAVTGGIPKASCPSCGSFMSMMEWAALRMSVSTQNLSWTFDVLHMQLHTQLGMQQCVQNPVANCTQLLK